ncbi:MAG: Uncharacterised protein [Flavobacteriaceae bacterium]|nr:MAG: Uncharacterised protein [Flavobacteriaceae bacterium]
MKIKLYYLLTFFSLSIYSQDNPVITSWLQNTSETGSYYFSGNSTTVSNNILVNCQSVEYSDNFAYISTQGIPAYPTGPFSDGNPSNAEAQNNIYKMPLNPQPNNSTPTNTTGGNIGVFINGVALFDYRDGVAWNNNTNYLCGGPGNPPCPGGPMATQNWNRDAIPAEMGGFDCSKGHPAQGNYHHHQNPSAFKLDLEVVSDICNLYDAEGLYAIDAENHSPLIGFAYDGYPIYGAYGFKNSDGSGGITRIESGYQLRNITSRTNGPDLNQVVTISQGPNTGSQETMFLGYFREDYEHVEHTDEEEYLDEHNGRFCVTPEYPNGTYAYFATVDENWNSAYPYAVGPTFYGVYENRIVNTISESTTEYLSNDSFEINEVGVSIIPNPASNLIAVQIKDLITNNLDITLYDINGKVIKHKKIYAGSTIAYFNVQTLYNGIYLVRISSENHTTTKRVIISR